MHNIHQIRVIHLALEAELNKIIAELARINDRINKKSATINKITSYQKEYAERCSPPV